MVSGLNTDVERNGRTFHVQTEDLGLRKPVIQTLVFCGGEVVTVLEFSYGEYLDSDRFSVDAVSRRLELQHHRLVCDVEAGVFDASGEDREPHDEEAQPEPEIDIAAELAVETFAEDIVGELIDSPPDSVEQCLTHLEENVEQTRPSRKRRPTVGRWFAVAAAISVLATIGLFRWVLPLEVEVAAPLRARVEPPAEVAPAPEPKPENEVPPPPAVAPDVLVEPTRPAEPVVERPPPAPEVLPAPSVAADPSAEEPAPDAEAAASFTPLPLPPVSNVVDPLEELEAATRPEASPIGPGEVAETKPEKPAEKQVRVGALLELAAVDVVPQATRRDFPEYPRRARKKKEQGRVELSLLIDEQGRVREIELAPGVEASDLTEAAIEAARAWRYAPARKGSVPVRVWKPVVVEFSLDERNATRVRVEE